MTEPRTDAGKRLLDWFGGPMRRGEKHNLSSAIAAIEAEATAAAEQRLPFRVVECPHCHEELSVEAVSPRQGEPVALDVMAEPMRAYIGVGAGKPRTEAGRLWHAEWHSGEYPNAPRKCGSMGCGFLGRILGLEYAALNVERLARAFGRPDGRYEGHMVVWKQGVGFLNDPMEGAEAVVTALAALSEPAEAGEP